MASIESPNTRTEDHNLSISSQPLNLTNIDDDVKILIFESLEWSDLISVAETSKTLHTAACNVYKRKYGRGRLDLHCPDWLYGTIAPDIQVWDPVKILKLLRNFGHVISHIFLNIEKDCHDYNFRPALVIHIESYVAKYCSKSLRRFLLVEPPRFLFKENQTPFINVESINFSYYRRLCEVPFSTIFPSLQHIELDISHSIWYDIVIAIPSMKKLSIDVTKSRENRALELEENGIKELLKLNPQIEDLELIIHSKFTDVLFQGFNENLPKLQRFSLAMRANFQRYHSDSVIDFKMRPLSKFINIPCTFSKLERFEYDYYCDNAIETIESCIFDFIAENKYLKSITLTSVRSEISKLFQLDSVLKNIEELNVEIFYSDFPPLSSDLILNLFSQSQSLKKLTLTAYENVFENLNDLVKSKIIKQEKVDGCKIKLTLYP